MSNTNYTISPCLKSGSVSLDSQTIRNFLVYKNKTMTFSMSVYSASHGQCEFKNFKRLPIGIWSPHSVLSVLPWSDGQIIWASPLSFCRCPNHHVTQN